MEIVSTGTEHDLRCFDFGIRRRYTETIGFVLNTNRRSVFKNQATLVMNQACQRKRIVKWMNMKPVRIVDSLLIARGE